MSENYPRKSVLKPMQYQDRECMTCGNTFRSAGNHNRLCHACKTHRTRADGEYALMEARA